MRDLFITLLFQIYAVKIVCILFNLLILMSIPFSITTLRTKALSL